jgi:uncharacterized protein
VGVEYEVGLSSGEHLLAELRALSSTFDGPPTTLVNVAKGLYAMRRLDEELREVLGASVSDVSVARADELERTIRGSAWFMAVLRAARACSPPEWWVGAGAVRDLVWDLREGSFDPQRIKDVDLVFFDPDDVSPERDLAVERALIARLPHVPWDAKNQAAVHTWYPLRFGRTVEPLASAAEAVATWPETATAVAVRLLDDDRLVVTAPYGLDDLLDGIYRRNPRRATLAEYRKRLAAKRVPTRWPSVRVVDT